mmetsp:Transcript_127674/g.248828  ORF Transcript_127674/g.248828 Transcript_127674/m.248828 type:complete len:449 (-) Transcript_127674:286-1632(-)
MSQTAGLDAELLEYYRAYQEGTPLRVVEIRARGALGAEKTAALVAALCSAEGSSGELSLAFTPEEEVVGSLAEQHGLLGNQSWAVARLAARAQDVARPGYDSCMAHEYLDTEEVLQFKVAALAGFMRRAQKSVVYAGAGLSTASGVGDYATRTGSDSVVAKGQGTPTGFQSPYHAKPNLGHQVVAAMAQAGLLWRIVQQNHDGLLQKAGVPQRLVNAIHGCWFDPGNPVVKFNEYLRQDLSRDVDRIEDEADLVLVLGSSLAGMSTDRIVKSCAARGTDASTGKFGSVIVSVQRTPHDAECSLRIFATIDRVMALLAAELNINMDAEIKPPAELNHQSLGPDMFLIPYDSNGLLLKTNEDKGAAPRRILDLRQSSELLVATGNDKGQRAVVVGKHPEGHYKLNVERSEAYGGVTAVRYLGTWWIQSAVAGDVPQMPVVTVDESVIHSR